MDYIKDNIYIQARRNRTKLYLRLYIGLQQLIYRPYNIILVLVLLFLYAEIWNYNRNLFEFGIIPLLFLPAFRYIIPITFVLIPIILLLGFIEYLGNMASRRDEAYLIVAFTAKDLRNGHPILIKRKKIKGTNVTIREFYSNIPMKVWIDTKEAIADQMNVHFVEPSIEYGGKKKNNGNRICLYTAPGRKRIERGNLYDDEL